MGWTALNRVYVDLVVLGTNLRAANRQCEEFHSAADNASGSRTQRRGSGELTHTGEVVSVPGGDGTPHGGFGYNDPTQGGGSGGG